MMGKLLLVGEFFEVVEFSFVYVGDVDLIGFVYV